MTPADFAAWAQVLRLDPLVLLVLALAYRELRRSHADAMALLRELRDLIRADHYQGPER